MCSHRKLGNKTVIKWVGCNRPEHLSFGTENDQVFYCTRPLASCNRTLDHSQYLKTNILVYCIQPI